MPSTAIEFYVLSDCIGYIEVEEIFLLRNPNKGSFKSMYRIARIRAKNFKNCEILITRYRPE